MTAQLIGLGGLLRSGKDAFADRLVEKHGWVKMGMSDPLNDALLTLDPYVQLGVDRSGESDRPEMVRYQSVHARMGYVEAKKLPEVRRLLMVLGTEVGRDMIGENTWVDIAARNIQNHLDAGTSVAITGIRFDNELQMIRDLGGESVWVERAGLEAPVSTHASENSVTGEDFDVTVLNHYDLDHLHDIADSLALGDWLH